MASESPVLVALGGNALILPGEKGYIEEQFSHTDACMKPIGRLISRGARVVLTHGNGPIVGNILLRNECARDRIPPMPLYICVADSQGGIGAMMAQSLGNELKRLRVSATVSAMITHVVVNSDDPSFREPVKPIGPYYSEGSARSAMSAQGWHMREIPGRGWRRLVPSPAPQRIIEIEAIRRALEDGIIPIVCGGGGIPVTQDGSALRGVDAVIDKDLTASLLARELGLKRIIILTDVDGVYLHWGSTEARLCAQMSVPEAREYMHRGEFPPGDMGPKIEAAIAFLQSGGGEVLITSPDLLEAALRGDAGTRITR